MADNTSVGKISLDLELTSDLSKQIEQAAAKIGDQIKAALGGIGNIDIGKQMTSSIEKSMDAMQKIIEQKLTSALEKSMANLKAMKIPVEFDIPKNFSMPKQNFRASTAQPRAPPINTGINMDALKAQIDNLGRSLDITNAKIEQQQAKLAGLKESYNQAFDGTRKNQLQDQILKTETAINKLTATSDKTGFKLADLDNQFEILSNAAKNASSGIGVADTKLNSIGNSASKANAHMKNMSSSTDKMSTSMNHSYGGFSMFFDSMIKWGLIFPMIINGINSVGSFLGASLMVNAQFANSLNQIKSNLYTAFMPIYQVILPAINSLISSLATATAYIASFISQLFGKTYEQSFNSAKALQSQIGAMSIADKQAKKAADSLGGVGKSAASSADATKKASKEIQGALAGFDEINKLQDNKSTTPKIPTPAGSGVITPITPMANMAPIEAATSGWADKFKNILANLWKPFQEAWAAEGQNTINAAHHALNGILALLGAIGRSFYIVWTNGTGERILVNLLKILQDILNIIGDIGVTFANAWNKGNIGTQVIQSLANALNNVLSLIDKMLQSIRRVWEQEGPIFANMFMQALQAGSNVIENLTQKLGWIWDNGGQHAFEGLVKLGLKVGELALFIFTNFVAPFVNWFVNIISPAIAVVLDWIGKLFDKLSGLIDYLQGDGAKYTRDFLILFTGFKIAGFIANMINSTLSIIANTTAKIANTLATSANNTANEAGILAKAKDIGANIQLIGLYAGETAAKVASTVATIGRTIATTAGTVAQIAHNIAVTAWTAICGIATIATTAFGIAVAFLTSPIGIVIIAIGALIAIGILLYKNWDTTSAFLNQCWDGIKNNAQYVWNGIKDFFSWVWSGITNNATYVWNGIKDFFSWLWNGITGTINNTWNSIKNFFGSIWNGIVNTGRNIWNGFSGFLSNLWGWISGTANNAWNGFRNIVSNLVQGTVNNAVNIWNGLLNWFGNLPGNFRNLGVDMINALGDGIRNTINNVVNIAKDLGSRILQGIKDIFGIHSPSREMFKVGNYFVQGFTNALSSSNIGSMVKSVFGDITGLAKGALGGPLGVMLKPMLDSGAFGKIGGFIQGVAKNGLSFLGGGSGGNVASWLQAAMAITGTPMQYLPMLENIAQHESGGDAKSINLWDSNAQAGHPSKGLMQMIDETFSTYAMPGMNDIWNPIDNAVSAIRYMIGRYGNIANVPGIRSQMNGGSYVGYATGTNSARKGLAMTGEVGPEMIDFSGGEMVLNLKNTIGLINSAVGAISNIKNAVTGTIQQPQLTMARSNSSSVSQNASDFTALKNAIIEAIREDRQQNNDNVVKLLQMILDIIKNLGMDIDIDGDKLARIVIKQLNRRTRMTGKTELIL